MVFQCVTNIQIFVSLKIRFQQSYNMLHKSCLWYLVKRDVKRTKSSCNKSSSVFIIVSSEILPQLDWVIIDIAFDWTVFCLVHDKESSEFVSLVTIEWHSDISFVMFFSSYLIDCCLLSMLSGFASFYYCDWILLFHCYGITYYVSTIHVST